MRFRHRAVLSALAIAAFIVAGSGFAGASTFLKEDIASLKKQSEAVVHAKVVDVRSYWDSDHAVIYTDVTLDIKGRLLGSSDNQMIVRVPGGTVGDFTVAMEGAPKFDLDDEVVAFIARWYDGAPMVAGYFQGLMKVEHDKLGNAFLHGGVADGLAMSELARQLRQSGR
ncbi:MAG TPA: hypothetical protein VFE84_00450 [Patescibacteria group bacterium]|jgi:hypothetical protein|nr:hypothetical protein [Patescibacteria group bacterium]